MYLCSFARFYLYYVCMAQTEVIMKQNAFSASATILLWMVFASFFFMSGFVNGERLLKYLIKPEILPHQEEKPHEIILTVIHFLCEGGKSTYQHVWPVSLYHANTYIYIYSFVYKLNIVYS